MEINTQQQQQQQHTKGFQTFTFGTTQQHVNRDPGLVSINDKSFLNTLKSQITNQTSRILIELDDQDLSNYKFYEDYLEKKSQMSEQKDSNQVRLSQMYISLKNSKADQQVFSQLMSQVNTVQQLDSFYLFAQMNSLYDVGLAQISQLLKKTTKIIQLDFTNSKVANINSVFEALLNVYTLTDIALNFSANPVQNLDSLKKLHLSALKSLTLEFKKCAIDERCCHALGLFIKGHKDLETICLDLSENRVNDLGVKHLTDGMINLNKVVYLHLGLINSHIGIEGSNRISNLISSPTFHQGLVTLNLQLGYNKIQTVGAQRLFQALSKCSELHSVYLNLSQNSLSEGIYENASLFLQSSNKLASISLDFSLNYLDSFYFDQFADNICQNKKLQYISFNFKLTQIEDTQCAKLFPQILNIPNLTYFSADLSCNEITQQSIINLKKSIDTIGNKKLKLNIDLRYNNRIGVDQLIELNNQFEKIKKKRNTFFILLKDEE